MSIYTQNINQLEQDLEAMLWARERQAAFIDDLCNEAFELEINGSRALQAVEREIDTQARYYRRIEREISTIEDEIKMETTLMSLAPNMNWIEQALDALETPRYLMGLA